MNHNQNTTHTHEDTFNILRMLSNGDNLNQRQISSELGFSLGKTNYLLKELVKKGIIKSRNFSRKNGKLKRVRYIITPKGVKARAQLTYHFLKRKEAEYKRLKAEWESIEDRS